MGESYFRVRTEGSVSIVEVWGPLDEVAAANLLDFAAAAGDGHTVRVDLDAVESISPEAAALLLFRKPRWQALVERITLRGMGRPGRHAVLRAYERRRRAGPS